MLMNKMHLEQRKIFRKLFTALRSFYDSFFPTNKQPAGAKHRTGVRMDANFQQLTTFANAELLCLAAYNLNTSSRNIEIIDEDTITRKYNVEKIPTKQPGIFAYVLYSPDADVNRVSVVFRGTYDTDSFRRDLELKGPGSSSFAKDKDIILQTIKKHVAQKPNAVLNIAGHSLGGSDSQNCAAAVFDDIVKNPHNNPLCNVSTINVMHKNAAGVTDKTAQLANKNAVIVKQKHNINLNQYIFHYHGDIVQQGGEATILSDMDPTVVNTYMLEADTRNKVLNAVRTVGSKLGNRAVHIGSLAYESLIAHRARIFAEPAANVAVKIYHNANPEQRTIIARHLSHKVLGRAKKKMSFVPKTKAPVAASAPQVGPKDKPEQRGQ